MRILPERIIFQPSNATGVLAMCEFIGQLHRQIIEITNSELAVIEKGWHREVYEWGTYEFPFYQYLDDLIALYIHK